MWWTVVFWVVYGVGSTLFVFFLFKLGNSVAGYRREQAERDVERLDGAGPVTTVVSGSVAGSPADHTTQLKIQRAPLPVNASLTGTAHRARP